MKNNKKLRRVLLLWAILLGICLQPIVARAQVQEITDANFQMVGGQIRTTTPMGLRFIAKIKKDYIAQQEREGKIVEYGIVLLPEIYLDGKELTADGIYLYKGKVYKPAVIQGAKKYAEDTDNIYYTAVLTNIAKERYKNEYAARAYVKLTEQVEQSDGKTKLESQWKYGDETIPKQVYEVAKEAVEGNKETEETKQWLQNNVLEPVDNPQGPTEEDKKIPFRLGKVERVTLYHKSNTSSENGAVEEVSNFTIKDFAKEQYLVKVELDGQPERFADIKEIQVTSENKVNFILNLDDYVTERVARQQQGAIVEFGTAEEGVASTKYITMQALIDKIKANPAGNYVLDHNLDASMVQGADELIPEFRGTFDGNGHKITGLNTTLFGTISGGTVKNVILENVAITKTSGSESVNNGGAGVLADKAEQQAKISGVHVSGTLKNSNSRTLMGGLVGRMDRATVEQCSVNLEISGSYNTVGGLIGQMSNGHQFENVVKDSYAVGSIKGSMSNGALGGLIGWHNNKNSNIVQNCYTAMSMNIDGTGQSGHRPGGFIGIMGESDATGTLANNVSYSNGNKGYKFDGASDKARYQTGTQISQNITLKETRLESDSKRIEPVNAAGKIEEKAYDELLNKDFYVNNLGWSEEVWDFEPLKEKKAPVLRNGDPNRIGMLQLKEVSTVEELKAINDDRAGVYVLTADIDVSKVTSGNSIITGNFSGLLKGNGHQITGQKIPLFEKISGGSVEGLILTDGEIIRPNEERVAALAKDAWDGSYIQDVYVRNMKIQGQTLVGGLVGHLDNSTVRGCSVVAQVDGREAGGFISNIMNVSTVTDCYAQRTTNPKTFGNETDVQGGFVAKMNRSTVTNTYAELKFIEEATETKAITAKVGSYVGLSGLSTESRVPFKVENNIAFGPQGYSFNAANTVDADFVNYKNNYEYKTADTTEKVDLNLTGKISSATAEQVNTETFYTETLKWDSKIWHLGDVTGGKRPRLEAEGDIYPSEGTGSEEIKPEATVAPEESIALMAALNQEERAGKESWETVKGYQPERKTLYENLEKFMPFYNREQIVKDGNAVDVAHKLNQKAVLAVYPMNENGQRIIALTTETVNSVKKLRIQFEKTEDKALIYDLSYIDTRSGIASYNVSQIPVHYNFNKYVVDTKTKQFQRLLSMATTFEFDTHIKTRVSQQDSDSVLDVYRRNYNNVVKKELEQILVAMTASYAQYPINVNHTIAEAIVTETFENNEYLKDFLYAYNYIDRWYDFEIGGINLRDVVIFDNSILPGAKAPRGLANEIVKISSKEGRQGNSTQSFYVNRISSYTGIKSISAFVEYFMAAYAGYSDVNDWIVDNFQGGVLVEARPNNPKVQYRMWNFIKSNTIQKDQQLILPVLSYKTSRNLYLASFSTALIYGNLQIYGGYQDTDQWRAGKRAEIASQLNDYKNLYDNFAEVARNGADSINRSKFLIVDSSYNKDRNQDVFKEFYKPLQTLWGHKSGAVAVIHGNPNYDYIYYNSSNFIGDLTVLNHEMAHVTDNWIWMENKGKRPGRNGEDYSNGFVNQAGLDYNMNFMKNYARDGQVLSNLTPERINSQEKFKSYYKEVFDVIYTLDYLQGLAYLQLTPEQQARVTAQHRYGFRNNHQSWNSANSTWTTLSASALENMNLQTLDDLWDNQLTIRPGHRFDLGGVNQVGINNPGAYQIDRVSYSSWYVPYVDGGTPNAQIFRRNGFELGGMFGYSDGLVRYLSAQTQTGDLQFYRTILNDPNFTFESYRKGKNAEIQQKIEEQAKQGNAYFDAEALIEYFRQNLINYGNDINSGMSNGNVTLQNIRDSRENVFRYLQRITNEFRTPVYGEVSDRNVVTIKTGQELVDKIKANPNGFYELGNDISMENVTGADQVYINCTFIGKLDGNGYKITNATKPLFTRITNSYVADLTIQDKAGTEKDWIAQAKNYTIVVKEQKKETVKEIRTLADLKEIGQNKAQKYVLKADIDASEVTETAIAKGNFSGILDGEGHSITGLKVPLLEKTERAEIRNLTVKNVQISNQNAENAAITKRSHHTVFENLNLENITISGTSYNGAITGYDYTGSVFNKIQIRNAKITGTKNYNAVFAGRASGSQISNIAVIESNVTLSGTDNGGFIGAGKNLSIRQVYSDADITVVNYQDAQNRTNSAGFIGNLSGESSVQHVLSVGNIVEEDAEKDFYQFLGTPDVLEKYVSDCYVSANTGGLSNVTAGKLTEVSKEEEKTVELYRDRLQFNEENWYLKLVGMRGYPEIQGMQKIEVIPIKTANDLQQMNLYPELSYRLDADLNLNETEQSEVMIPNFTGTLDGNQHSIEGLRVPLFGTLGGTVKNLAILNSEIQLNGVNGGVLANQIEGGMVETLLMQNVQLKSEGGAGALLAGTMQESTVQNVFLAGKVAVAGKAAGFAVSDTGSTVENVYLNVEVQGAEGAGFLAESKGEGSYTNLLSVGNVSAEMPKLMADGSRITNGYEFAAADGIAAKGKTIKSVGKEIWTSKFYTENLGFSGEKWNAENAEKNGLAVLKGFEKWVKPFAIQITKPQQVVKLNQVPEGKFAIAADLDFSAYEGELVTVEFSGILNGGNHRIIGISKPLFQKLKGTVENLQIENCLVESTDTGANVFAKESANATIKNVFFNGITMNGGRLTGLIGSDQNSNFDTVGIQNIDMTVNGAQAGVLLAKASGTQMKDVLITDAKITTEQQYVGGLIGHAENVTITKVFADSEVHIPYNKSPEYTSAFIGAVTGNSKITYSTAAGGVYPEDAVKSRYKILYMKNSSDRQELQAFTNCFYNRDTPGMNININDPKGVRHSELSTGDFYQNTMQLDAKKWEWSKAGTTGSPRLISMPESSVKPPSKEQALPETPLRADVPEGYTAIYTVEELLAAKGSSNNYILMQPISLYGLRAEGGSFLGDFSGTFDGNGLTIRDMQGAPLFGTLSGMVENLKLADVKVERWNDNEAANAFATSLSGATVNRVALYNVLVAGGNKTASLAGEAENSKISEIWAEELNVNPYGPAYKGTAESKEGVGGLIAYLKNGTSIIDCFVSGEMTANGDYQGGVFGYNEFRDEGTNIYFVNKIISNMQMRATTGGDYKRGGLIGHIEIEWDMWLQDCIAIGNSGIAQDAGSLQAIKRFTGSALEFALRYGVANCYEGNQSGQSSANGDQIKEVSREKYATKDFYMSTLKFTEDKWNFANVTEQGYPTLIWLEGAKPEEPEEQLPALPAGSEVTVHPKRWEIPGAEYIPISTPEEFMKIEENPSGKYVLMNNISLEQVRLPEGQTSYITKPFTGELYGNNQVIHGLRAAMFNEVSGKIHELRVQNVFVTAEGTNPANGFARTLNGATIEKVVMDYVQINGGSYTAALAGTATNKAVIHQIWLENIQVNALLTETYKFNFVGGAVGQMTGSSNLEDVYISGMIVLDNHQEGGVVGELNSGTVNHVVENMRIKSFIIPGNTWQGKYYYANKAGVVGDVNNSSAGLKNWKITNCLAMGDASKNAEDGSPEESYKFLGRDVSTYTTNNISNCYELATVGGPTNTSEATIAAKILMLTSDNHKADFYTSQLKLSSDVWDLTKVGAEGFPRLKWMKE